jgi:branched-subunit amino acid transport protein
MSWRFVLALAAGCYLTKLLGYAVPARVLESPYVARVAVLAPVGLLTALVLTQTLTEGAGFALEPRAAGVLVAVVAVALRAPFAVVVLSAIATAAALRALG